MLTLPEHLSSPSVFSGVRVTLSLVLYVCFVDRCLSFCTFYFDRCLFLFDIRILITPLVSSNSFCPFSFGHCVVFFFDIRIMITPLVSSNPSWKSRLGPGTNMWQSLTG